MASFYSNQADHPLAKLPREDLDLIVQLVLRSGSLKDLAEAYGVSYPTIRSRLDRVIQRLDDAVKGKQPDKLRELLARLVERGELTVGAAHAIRDAVREADSAHPKTEQVSHAPGASGVAGAM